MKNTLRNAITLGLLAMGGTAPADIVYSNFLNTTIPDTYGGTTATVGDGTLNLFFGGAGAANNDKLQPFRTSSAQLGTMKAFALDDTSIGAGAGFLATGYGGSIDHVGSQFTAGTEAYAGFQLDGVNYGWMRVILTNNAGGAVVKDWAYDTSGAAIKTGLIKTDISGSGQTITTLNPGASESFTLGSTLADATGYTGSLLKTGAGNVVLTGLNTYTGPTTVNTGTLTLASGTSLANTSAVTVGAGATLTGAGTIHGATTIQSGGHLAGGASPATQTFSSSLTFNSGSIFDWSLNASTADTGTTNQGAYSRVIGNGASGSISGSGATFAVALGTNGFTDAFWDTQKTWSDIFSGSGAPTSMASVFSSITGAGIVWDSGTSRGNVSGQGYFTLTPATLTWTPVPELSNALAAWLLGFGLLRRQRTQLRTVGRGIAGAA